MENFNRKAFSEVIEILNHTDEDVIRKIPQKFIDFLFENSDKEYIPNIDFDDEQWEKSIQEDTQTLLALIYRDYIVSNEERLQLLKEEREEKIRKENEMQEKYNADNIFKNKPVEEKKQVDNLQLTEIKETSWFKKALDKILKFFGRKK